MEIVKHRHSRRRSRWDRDRPMAGGEDEPWRKEERWKERESRVGHHGTRAGESRGGDWLRVPDKECAHK